MSSNLYNIYLYLIELNNMVYLNHIFFQTYILQSYITVLNRVFSKIVYIKNKKIKL